MSVANSVSQTLSEKKVESNDEMGMKNHGCNYYRYIKLFVDNVTNKLTWLQLFSIVYKIPPPQDWNTPHKCSCPCHADHY